MNYKQVYFKFKKVIPTYGRKDVCLMGIYIYPECNTGISRLKPYKSVYFRVKTPTYYPSTGGVGFSKEEEGIKFHNEAVNLFLKAGWEIKKKQYNGRCNEVSLNKQYLYLHPQNFSGAILPENIEGIKYLINTAALFSCYHIDIYDDVYDLSDEEYLSVLEANKYDIQKSFLDLYKTKRKNLYITSDLTGEIIQKHRIKRIVKDSNSYSSSDIDYIYFEKIFEELVEDGFILTSQTRNGIGYRTNTITINKDFFKESV